MDHSSQSQGVSTTYRTFDIRTISGTLHSEVVESTCWRAAATRGWIWGGPPDERHWHTTLVFDMRWYASMEEVDLLTSPVAKVSAVWRHRNLRLAYIAQHHFFHLSEFLKSTPLHYFQVRFRLWIFFGCLKRFMWWCFWCFSLTHPKQIRLEELWSWTCWHAISHRRCLWGKVGMQRLRGDSHCRRAKRRRSIVRTVCYVYCRCSVATDEKPPVRHDFGVRTWRPNMAREEKR